MIINKWCSCHLLDKITNVTITLLKTKKKSVSVSILVVILY